MKMIDLRDTWIPNVNGELYDLWFAECEKQGIIDAYRNKNNTVKKRKYLQEYRGDVCATDDAGNAKEVTLADLKPKPFLQTGEAFEHTKTLNFILERMINVHGEHDSVDYIHKLSNAITFVEKVESPKQKIELQKPKRVKVDYVKVDKNADNGKYWECARQLAESECEFFIRGNIHLEIRCNEILLENYKSDELYRKVEREIVWQDSLSDFMDDNFHDQNQPFLSFVDEEVVIDGKIPYATMIAMCHLMQSMTDKPK